MTDEPLRLDDADEEETRAARALQRALDGGSASADLPGAALETAALLRFSADGGRLTADSRARLREEVLASLPERKRARKGFGQLLTVWLPLFGAATLAVILFVRNGGDASAPSSTDGLAAAPAELRAKGAGEDALSRYAAREPRAERAVAAQRGESPPRAQELGDSAREYRSRLLATLHEPELDRAHAELDRAASREELERSRQTLTSLSSSLEAGEWSPTQARLVRQDLFCRLAEAALRLGEPQSALEWTRQGIDLDGPPTPFLAQLMSLEGQALAALGDRLGAAKSLMKALELNQALLDESLDGP